MDNLAIMAFHAISDYDLEKMMLILKSPSISKTAKVKAQGNSINTKDEAVCIGVTAKLIGRSPNLKKLPLMQFGAKMLDHNMHQAIKTN